MLGVQAVTENPKPAEQNSVYPAEAEQNSADPAEQNSVDRAKQNSIDPAEKQDFDPVKEGEVVGIDQRIVKVINVGDHQYAGQTRIRYPGGKALPCWVASSRLRQLVFRQALVVRSPLLCADEAATKLPQGTCIEYWGTDDDGDINVRHGSRRLPIFWNDMGEVELCKR